MCVCVCAIMAAAIACSSLLLLHLQTSENMSSKFNFIRSLYFSLLPITSNTTEKNSADADAVSTQTPCCYTFDQ